MGWAADADGSVIGESSTRSAQVARVGANALNLVRAPPSRQTGVAGGGIRLGLKRNESARMRRIWHARIPAGRLCRACRAYVDAMRILLHKSAGTPYALQSVFSRSACILVRACAFL